MNLPENIFIFNVFRVCPIFSVKLLLFKINLLLIFTLTDFLTDSFRADAANLSQQDVRS